MIHDPLQLRPQLGSKIPTPLVVPMEIPMGSPRCDPRHSPCTIGRGRRGDFSIDKRGAGGWRALVLGC